MEFHVSVNYLADVYLTVMKCIRICKITIISIHEKSKQKSLLDLSDRLKLTPMKTLQKLQSN